LEFKKLQQLYLGCYGRVSSSFGIDKEISRLTGDKKMKESSTEVLPQDETSNNNSSNSFEASRAPGAPGALQRLTSSFRNCFGQNA